MMKEITREEMLQSSRKKYYFMAGLPRSGSTLLSSILNQNPKMHSGPSSPVVNMMVTLEQEISNDELFLAYPKPEQAGKIISSIIENYYSDVDSTSIIDKNRSWVTRIHYIEGYFGIEPKILCPVRNMDEILTSFIAMHRRNRFNETEKINFIDEMLIKNNIPLNDENRCQFLSGPNGVVGQSYGAIQQAIMEGKEKYLHFIEYDDLINSPEETMRKIYEFLGEEYFEHDFSKLENVHKENDTSVYGLPDMHDVRSELSKVSINPNEILPESILEKCKDTEFWRKLEDYVEEDFQPNSNINSNSTDEKQSGKLIGA
jgi:sulfotransferase